MNARTLFVMMSAAGFLGASGPSVAGELTKSPIRLTDTQAEKTKAPIRLTDAQMEKVVAGGFTLNTDPANSPNSCNSGHCNYDNPQGDQIGKPVTGFNN